MSYMIFKKWFGMDIYPASMCFEREPRILIAMRSMVLPEQYEVAQSFWKSFKTGIQRLSGSDCHRYNSPTCRAVLCPTFLPVNTRLADAVSPQCLRWYFPISPTARMFIRLVGKGISLGRISSPERQLDCSNVRALTQGPLRQPSSAPASITLGKGTSSV